MEPNNIRHSVNSGSFYPIDPAELTKTIENSMNFVGSENDVLGENVRAIISPNVPYLSGGELYASLYAPFLNIDVDEIFIFTDPLLHKHDFIAFSDYIAWEIPLGRIKQTHRLDEIVKSDDSLKDLLRIDNSKHQGEIGIEVQLPYIYLTMGESVRIVPFMVGDTSPRLVSNYLSSFVDPEDIMICVSNISSGIPIEYAKVSDEVIIKAITGLDSNYLENNDLTLTAPRSVALISHIAKQKGWKPKVLRHKILEISGSAGRSTVGAASIVFIEE